MLFWRARSHAAHGIDNNPRPPGFQESLAGVSAHAPKLFSLRRAQRKWLRQNGSKGARVHEKVAPKRAQNSGQAAPPAHTNRWPSLGHHYYYYCRVLQKPDRANTRRKPPDYLSV